MQAARCCCWILSASFASQCWAVPLAAVQLVVPFEGLQLPLVTLACSPASSFQTRLERAALAVLWLPAFCFLVLVKWVAHAMLWLGELAPAQVKWQACFLAVMLLRTSAVWTACQVLLLLLLLLLLLGVGAPALA